MAEAAVAAAVTDRLSSTSENLTTENAEAMKIIKELEARLAKGKDIGRY